MRLRPKPVEALVTLPRLEHDEDRRANWRQVVAALGRTLRPDGPPPLDGIRVDEVVRGARAALQHGLADDMDWIAPESAAVALYELSSALPAGNERREFGRRAFSHLYGGTAGTFAAVATRMALGNAKPLQAATMRARVSLVCDLPIGADLNTDGLAYNIIARRDLREDWIIEPSRGALHSRRLAARLLEHAAREAVTRFDQGDPYPQELMRSEDVAPALNRLLADREPLVWRHAAVARGLLATVVQEVQEEVEVALDPALTPTEWRRAAVSLVAGMSRDTELGMKQCRSLLAGEIEKRDPGIAATMVWGLPVVIETEPEAAEELLDWLTATLRLDVAEATADLLKDVVNPVFGARAAEIIRHVLKEQQQNADPVTEAILELSLQELDREDDDNVAMWIRRGLVAYERRGARQGFELAQRGLQQALMTLSDLQQRAPHGVVVPGVFPPLMSLDAALLQQTRLSDLLLLGRRPGETDNSIPEMDQLFNQLGSWLLDGEEHNPGGSWSRTESAGNQRRYRVLLHLIDLETAHSDDEVGSGRVRVRVRRALRLLLRRLTEGPDSTVHRILCASLARCFDAAVREGVGDPADIMLIVASNLADRFSVGAVAEAAISPVVAGPLAAWERFLERGARKQMDSIAEGTFDPLEVARQDEQGDEAKIARSVISLSRRLAGDGSYRGEALRQVVLRIGRALEGIAAARGLSEMVDATGSGNPDPLGDLEAAADALRRMTAGANRRLLESGGSSTSIMVFADVPPLSALVERAVTAGVPANADQIAMAIGELVADLPNPIAAAVSSVLARARTLPTSPPSDVYAIPLQKRREMLPDWLLPRRTVGGFYVVRALGAGGVSSVFVARRIEERHDKAAELFALKVPEYDPTTARQLTEQEFMQLFRDEAGALLSLPRHENLANFVTFDLAARPKPILVMELIRGFSLDRMIRSRSLTAERALSYLDGILAGIEAMHEVGVGHLDVKPNNVILREGETPVLVDFGLSGRQLRPGCGTLEYCSPEILGVIPKELTAPPPAAADMYAFACTSYEILTASSLFDAEDETALASAHVTHDGWPEKLVQLAADPDLTDLATVFAACLRRDPRNRPTATEARNALRYAGEKAAQHNWPLVAPQRAASA